MSRTERRDAVERHRVMTPDGQESLVEATTTFMRVQYLDLSWSEWQQEVTRFKWGRMPVNLREDGDWETAELQPRRLTRLP